MTKLKSKNDNLLTKKGTLDQKHTEKVAKFEKMNKSLPHKMEKLKKLQNELDELSSMNPNKYTHDDIRRKAHLMDLIDKLKTEIKSIENCTESLNYIVNTLPILINYYDNDEIVDDNDIEENLINETDENKNGKKNILSYFMRESNDKLPSPKNTKKRKISQIDSGSKTTIDKSNKTKNSGMSRAKLYDSYLNAIDANYQKSKDQKKNNMCSVPGCDGEKIITQHDGYMVCKKCGASEITLVATEKPNYNEPTQDSGTYAYKRINHLTEILSQLQAKESTDIPPKVFESIVKELKKRKIDKNELDIFRLRRILKKLNYRKYYEHVPHILQIINGKEPPNFSRTDEMKIKKCLKTFKNLLLFIVQKIEKIF